MNILELTISIAIQISLFFIASVIIAIPLGIALYFFSKRKRKRKAFFGLLSPFIFLFSNYFICLIGGYSCATFFKTGCGMDRYWHTPLANGYDISTTEADAFGDCFIGCIQNNSLSIVESVSDIKVSGDTIYGKIYFSKDEPDNHEFFTLDTKSGNLDFYSESSQTLTSLESFYYESWKWVKPLGIVSLFVSSLLVLLLWFVLVRLTLPCNKIMT